MFIKTKLIKEINTFFYKNLEPGINLPIKSQEDVNNVYVHILEKNPEVDPEVLKMIQDCIYDTSSSDLAQSLNNIVNGYTLKIQNSLQDTSDATKELMQILSVSPEACVVGGCIRDSMIDRIPNDYDFCTDTDYDTLKKLLSDSGFAVKETGKEFLVLICSKNGEFFEIANFRKDLEYNGRHPVVEIGTLEDDAFRRDFYINSLSYNLTSQRIQDPTGQGIQDIIDKVIRFVGNPIERLEEDYIRAFRFHRFMNKLHPLGFKADTRSLKAVRSNWDRIYEKATPGRVRLELEKMSLLTIV